jgi:DNA-binding response OmpR family regulator
MLMKLSLPGFRFRMPYKIIVADDSPSIQKIIHLSFPVPEYEIFAFNNGIEFIDSFKQIKPDAILLNLSLPQKDGYEVGAYIKGQEEFSRVPLILLKEAFEPLDKERIAAFEYDELIQKPFDSEMLVQKVRTMIEGQKVPNTLPEEPVWGEEVPDEKKVEPDEKLRHLVKQEILDVERELEKRIKARILAELKMWLIDNQKK